MAASFRPRRAAKSCSDTARPRPVGCRTTGTGGSLRLDDTVTAHLLAVLGIVDAERIRKCRFRVVLDSNHGAGGILGRRLLHELACRVTVLGEEPDGQFAHPAEPTAENLAGVLAAVTDAGAEWASARTPTPTAWP